MYGDHKIPYEYEDEYVKFSISKTRGYISYNRSYLDKNIDTRVSSYEPNHNFKYYNEDMEKLILSDERNILICPVEPVNKPVELSRYLEIEFDNSVIVRPKFTKKIYLTFPIEIGIFLQSKKRTKNIDVITFALKKFTLYGPENEGMICTYWNSEVFIESPSLNPLIEGVMELTLRNNTNEWIEVSRAIFDSNGMKLFYTDSLVSMKALMKIQSKTIAETIIFDEPIMPDMKKSFEICETHGVPIVSRKMIMAWGL